MNPFAPNSPVSSLVAGPSRKPRVMVAGEFSSGKSKLINGLLGETVLPSNVTATALPPIWLVSGEKGLHAIDLEGAHRPVGSLEEVCVEDTRYCVLSHPAACLQKFEIIDTPGNSDPNIPSESWERMLDFADTVVWCSNATQAWRQSEKSVWNDMPERLLHATLIITHADRMTDPISAQKVMRRVTREADGFFGKIIMASLIQNADIARITHHLETTLKDLRLSGDDNNIALEMAAAQVISQDAALSARPKTGATLSDDYTKVITLNAFEGRSPVSRPAPTHVVTQTDATRVGAATKMVRNMS